jgi:hypothetical protein
MAWKPVNFGKPYPSFLMEDQRKEGSSYILRNGFIDLDGAFVKRHGYSTFTTISSAHPVVSIAESIGGSVLAVCNGVINDISSIGTVTPYTGDAPTAATNCAWAENDQNHLFCSYGGKIIDCNTTTMVGAYLAGNSPTQASHVAYADRYLLANDLAAIAGDEVFSDGKGIHAYSDADSWEYWNNAAAPDACTAVHYKLDWRENYAVGPRTIEISKDDGTTPWADAGVSSLPGCIAPWTFCEAWLPPAPYTTGEMTYYYLSSYRGVPEIVRITRRGVESISQPQWTTLSVPYVPALATSRGWFLMMNGMPFYILDLSQLIVLAYSIQTDCWSVWEYYSGGVHNTWPVACIKFIQSWGKWLIGSRSNDGVISCMDWYGDSCDGTNPVRFELQSAPITHGTNNRKQVHRTRFRWTGGSSNHFTYNYKEYDDVLWNSITVTPDGSDGGVLYSTLPPLGMYRNRQNQIIHDTGYPFAFVGMEEDIDIMVD